MTVEHTLAGKHAFVTGASRGIGAAIATELERAGATVTRIARHARDGVLACDVTAVGQVDAAMTLAERQHGSIDILINNAGIAASSPFGKTEPDMLDHLLNVNFKGAWHCSQRALPGMLDAGWGRIVNIASLAGLAGYPYVSAYCASKHALLGLTRSLAAEMQGHGVAISAICPGYTDTDMLTNSINNIVLRTSSSTQQARATLATLNPDGCIVTPQEIAVAVVALCLSPTDRSNGRIVCIPELPQPSEAST